jgi:TusA-related sulfurtransferase
VTAPGQDGDARPPATTSETPRLVDARGLTCPQPVRELAAAIDAVQVGDDLVLEATDPTSRVDVPVWCRLNRHRLRAVEQVDGGWRYLVRRC